MMKMSPSWIGSLPTHEMTALHGVGERPDVGGEVILAFGDHAPIGGADGGAEVAALADDEGVGHSLEHQAHLVDDAHEGVAEHLEGDRVDLVETGRRGGHRAAPG